MVSILRSSDSYEHLISSSLLCYFVILAFYGCPCDFLCFPYYSRCFLFRHCILRSLAFNQLEGLASTSWRCGLLVIWIRGEGVGVFDGSNRSYWKSLVGLRVRLWISLSDMLGSAALYYVL